MAGSVRKDGLTWYYVLERMVDGQRKQTKKRGFKTKKEAQIALVKLQNDVNNGSYIEPSKLLYRDYLEDWMKDRMINNLISKETAEVNSFFIKKHILPAVGHIPISKITALTIQNFVREIAEKGLASSTIKRIFNIVNASLNKAEKLQIISKNYATLVDKPKLKKKELTVWAREEVLQFIKVAQEHRIYIAFHLALMTGMRQGEILGLRWSDVDYQNRNITVRQTLSHNGKELKPGAKTNSSVRSISLDSETISLLQTHRKRQLEEKMQARDIYDDHGLIVCTELGRPTIPSNLRKVYIRLQESAAVRKITFHDLRHTHATMLLIQNVHPKIVSERLGHSSIKMTLDTYSHLMPNMQEDAANELARSLFNLPTLQEAHVEYVYNTLMSS